MAVRKRKTARGSKAAPATKNNGRRKRVGDVLGLSGSRPPKSRKPVKASTGKRRRRTGVEVERRRRPTLPQARVRL